MRRALCILAYMSNYSVRQSARARSMRLDVHPDGAVVVVVPHSISSGAIAKFVERHRLWIERAVARTRDREVIYIKRSDIPRLKREAYNIANQLAAAYGARYGYHYAKISIRAQRARWGSCSSAGNLSFNYKIAALPRQLAEYIVVHEICHLGAFDHSPRFWQLVAQEVPDHRALRSRLRRTTFMTVT